MIAQEQCGETRAVVRREQDVELEQLIATEQRLDESLRRARAAAARLVDEAKGAAGRAEAALSADIEAAATAMALQAETERRDRESAVAREAAEQVARTDGVAAARIQALARDMVNLLLADAS